MSFQQEEARLRREAEEWDNDPYRTEVCGLCGKRHFVDRNGEFYGECNMLADPPAADVEF